MRRTRLRAALLLTVVAAVGTIGYLVSRNVAARRVDPLRELGVDFLPQVAQRIQNFRRVKVEKGRTVWQITARDAQYFEQTGEIVVRDPEMTFFLEGNRQAYVAGAEGRLVLHGGKELESLTLSGSVAIRLDDLELKTEQATYNRERDLITSAVAVTVTGRTLEVQGKGMEVEVGPQLMRLLDDVHTVVKNNAASS
jgi:LPS export ABC transporter protein LptC